MASARTQRFQSSNFSLHYGLSHTKAIVDKRVTGKWKRSCAIAPAAASMAVLPCLISASWRNLGSTRVAKPRGSKPTYPVAKAMQEGRSVTERFFCTTCRMLTLCDAQALSVSRHAEICGKIRPGMLLISAFAGSSINGRDADLACITGPRATVTTAALQISRQQSDSSTPLCCHARLIVRQHMAQLPLETRDLYAESRDSYQLRCGQKSGRLPARRQQPRTAEQQRKLSAFSQWIFGERLQKCYVIFCLEFLGLDSCLVEAQEGIQ